MNHITADEATCDHLRGLLEPVEIRDAQGKLLGHYTPYVSPEERELYAKAIASLDLAEIKRRNEMSPGPAKPLAEINRRLEAGDYAG